MESTAEFKSAPVTAAELIGCLKVIGIIAGLLSVWVVYYAA